MEIGWTICVDNEEVLQRVKEDRKALYLVKYRKEKH